MTDRPTYSHLLTAVLDLSVGSPDDVPQTLALERLDGLAVDGNLHHDASRVTRDSDRRSDREKEAAIHMSQHTIVEGAR